jgi:CBS domain containing-hemolysin-like protein
VNPAVAIGVAVVLLAVNGFFVGAEFALLASRQSRLEQMEAGGDRRAEQALYGIRHLSLMLAGAQLGITMASLGLGAVAEPALAGLLEDAFHAVGLTERLLHPVSFALALAFVVFCHMVVGEMAPKSWAIADPESAALRLARPFRLFVVVLRPVIRGLNAAANAFVRLCGVTPEDERAMAHSPADLALLLRESVEEGKIDEGDVELFSNALRLSGLGADAAMTPRESVISVGVADGADAIEAAARRSGRSRLLVVGTELDDVKGVVHVRDVLLLDGEQRERATAGELVRPVLVGREHQALEDLLLDMRSQRLRFAVVVDDLGSLAGVVTLQSLLEALIGRSGTTA